MPLKKNNTIMEIAKQFQNLFFPNIIKTEAAKTLKEYEWSIHLQSKNKSIQL